MKQLLLLSTGLMAFSTLPAFAQDEVEEPDTYSPGFVIEVNRINPADDMLVIEMAPTDHTKSGANTPVYNATVTVPVFENSHTKYWFNVIYTPEEGESLKYDTSIERGYEEGELTVTIAAWIDDKGALKTSFSNTPYVLCDENWTAMGYFEGSATGQPQTTYLNDSPEKNYSAIRNINLSASTDEFIAGGNNQFQSFFVEGDTPGKKKNGLWKAVFDYSIAAITFEEVHGFTVDIEKYRTFVAPAKATVPTGLKAYHFAGYADGVMTMDPIIGNEIAANVPVILVAETPGEYTLALTGEPEFNFSYSSDGKRAWMASTAEEGSIYYGVHQPNFVPMPGYLFDGNKFVKVSSKTIVDTFRCDIRLTDEEAEGIDEIEVVYNEDVLYLHYTTEDGSYHSTHNEKLLKIDNGDYELKEINFTGEGNTHFVLSNKNFTSTYSMLRAAHNDSWSGFKGMVYHLDGENMVAVDPTAADEIKPFSKPAGTYALKVSTDETGVPQTVAMTADTQSGIENIMSEKGDDYIYNIFGQKVDENYKGIVIRNGKKFMNR